MTQIKNNFLQLFAGRSTEKEEKKCQQLHSSNTGSHPINSHLLAQAGNRSHPIWVTGVKAQLSLQPTICTTSVTTWTIERVVLMPTSCARGILHCAIQALQPPAMTTLTNSREVASGLQSKSHQAKSSSLPRLCPRSAQET